MPRISTTENRLHVPLVVIVSLIAFSAPSAAGTISLAWDPVSHPDLAGYRVFHGTQPDTYVGSVDVGTTPAATLSGLAACTDHYVAVKGRADDGSLSDEYSVELSGWARPEIDSVQPAALSAGSRVDLVVDGANFRSGAAVLFDHPALTINGVSVSSCTRLVVDVTVAPSASAGGVDIEVENPSGVFGGSAGLLTVTGDQSGPAISGVVATGLGATTATIEWDTDEAADSLVFYRDSAHSIFQPPVSDATLTTRHSVALFGLSPNTTYEYYVVSADSGGNTTSSTPTRNFGTTGSSRTFVRIEAEAGALTQPVETASGADAFRAAWISTPPGTANGSSGSPAGTADYGFHLPSSGTWYFWYRALAPTALSESWYTGVDGSSLATLRVDPIGSWVWVEGPSRSLGAGLHSLRVGGRRAETRLDRILITDDPGFRPAEAPDADRTAPPAVSALGGVSQDGAASLTWVHPASADLDRVIVRYRTDGVSPQGPFDGFPLMDQAATPGSPGNVVHTGVSNGTTLYYAVFAIDRRGNASDAATVAVTPQADVEPMPQVLNLRRGDVH